MKALLLILLAGSAQALEIKAPSPNSGTITPSTVSASNGYFSSGITASSVTATTGVVGGGAGGTVTSEIRVTGSGGAPPASGSSGSNTRFRIGAVDGNVLDFGNYATSPYGVWLQGSDRGDFSTKYPMALQPNGGSVGIGTASPCSTCTLHVAGGASVTGALTAGPARVGGTLFSWVGSSTTQGGGPGTIVGHSETIPANTLVNNGDMLEVFCLAKATTTSLSKILSVTVDGDQDGTGTSTNVARQWTNKSIITRTASTNLMHHAERERGDPAGTQGQSVDIDYTNTVAVASSFVVSCDIRADNNNTGPGDEVMDLKQMVIKYIPAP